MIIVYTGNGKGKTTAALGLALRAVGWGDRVLIVQFLKKQETGEARLLNTKNLKLNTQIKLEQYGTESFIDPKHLKPVDYQEAQKALKSVQSSVLSFQYDLIILDEINVAVKFGLIAKKEVLNLLRQKPKDLTLVLTGRWAVPEIIEQADLVTEFREIKYPFKKGINSRKGIDY